MEVILNAFFFYTKRSPKSMFSFNCKNTHLATDYVTISFYSTTIVLMIKKVDLGGRKYSLDINHWVCGHHPPSLIILAVKNDQIN